MINVVVLKVMKKLDWRCAMASSELEKWKAIRNGLDDIDIETRHQYGFWSKEVLDDGIIEYKRVCKKCGAEFVTSSHEPEENIEGEIKRQDKGSEFVNFFVNCDEDKLTNSDIILFLCSTSKYHTAMDIEAVIEKIKGMNRYFEEHHDYEEVYIHNSVVCLERFGSIPPELLEGMVKYLNDSLEKDIGKGRS